MSTNESNLTSFEMLHSAAAAQLRNDANAASPRDHVLQLGVLVGNLCSSFLTNAPLDSKREPLDNVPTTCAPSFWTTDSKERQEIVDQMIQLLAAIALAAETCHFNLGDCILKKIQLNNKKYPVHLVKGKSGKYTSYSEHTGITKTSGQSTRQVEVDEAVLLGQDETRTVQSITECIRRFATDRLWSRFHTPRNLVLAIMGELGELAELFQWKGDDATFNKDNVMDGWSQDDLDHVGQEFADVTIYLLRLADVCCVEDIGGLALASMRIETDRNREDDDVGDRYA